MLIAKSFLFWCSEEKIAAKAGTLIKKELLFGFSKL
jgi:hypothetical protein